MRHNRIHHRFGRTSSQSQAVLRNLVISLFDKERVETTETRAKQARRLAESLITFAKRGDLHARRRVARLIHDKKVLKKLFEEIGPRYAERNGGYTRVIRTRTRKGDVAQMTYLELVEAEVVKKRKKKTHPRFKHHDAGIDSRKGSEDSTGTAGDVSTAAAEAAEDAVEVEDAESTAETGPEAAEDDEIVSDDTRKTEEESSR